MEELEKIRVLRNLHEPCRKCGAAPKENCKHSNSKDNDVKPDENISFLKQGYLP